MTDAPAFDFYPERFWFAVEGWTDAEIVRYWRLLGQQWMRDGLPADLKELAGLARGKLTDRLLAKFPVAEDGLRRNLFLEKLRSEQRQRIAKRREGAAKTNAKRWKNESLSDSLSDPENDHSASRSATRSATVERQLSDIDSESPPPTTHHSPQTFTPERAIPPERMEPPRHGARHGGEGMEDLANPGIPPVTLEQAKANAGQYGASPEIAEKWWLEQDARGWLDGRGQAIARPWSSLRSFAIGWQGREAVTAARGKSTTAVIPPLQPGKWARPSLKTQTPTTAPTTAPTP